MNGPGKVRWIGPSPSEVGPWVGSAPDSTLELEGRVVVLHLHSDAEIATAHTIEGVERLAWRFHDRALQALGVYVGDTRTPEAAHMKSAVALSQLLGPTVPTVLDATGALAARYGAPRLPALVVLDAMGAHVGSAHGDPDWRALETTLERLIVAEAMSGALKSGETRGVSVTPEVAVSVHEIDEAGAETSVAALVNCASMARRSDGVVAISDTTHNRVLVGRVVGDTLKVQWTIGSGAPAFFDGRISEAALCRPRGVTFDGAGNLIIADTGNHAIRHVNLASPAPFVVTLAGTGRCGTGEERCAQELLPALTVDLRSPWSVECLDGTEDLAIVMGDDPRPWQYQKSRGRIFPLEDETTTMPTSLLPPSLPTMPQRSDGAAPIRSVPTGPGAPIRPGAGLARGEPLLATLVADIETSPLGTTIELRPLLEAGRWAPGSVYHVSPPVEVDATSEDPVVLSVVGQLEDAEYGSVHVVGVTVQVSVSSRDAAPFVIQLAVDLAPGEPPRLRVME